MMVTALCHSALQHYSSIVCMTRVHMSQAHVKCAHVECAHVECNSTTWQALCASYPVSSWLLS